VAVIVFVRDGRTTDRVVVLDERVETDLVGVREDVLSSVPCEAVRFPVGVECRRIDEQEILEAEVLHRASDGSDVAWRLGVDDRNRRRRSTRKRSVRDRFVAHWGVDDENFGRSVSGDSSGSVPTVSVSRDAGAVTIDAFIDGVPSANAKRTRSRLGNALAVSVLRLECSYCYIRSLHSLSFSLHYSGQLCLLRRTGSANQNGTILTTIGISCLSALF